MTYLKKTSNIIPLIILLTGSIITISLFIHFKDLYKENENEILTRISRETEKIIMSRLKTYEDIHYAGGALYHAFGDVKYEQWKKWVEANKLLSVYPGIRGIGIAVPVNRKDSLSFLREMKAEIPDYKISSFGEIENEPVRFIIKYIEPTWANSAALGVDMGSEKERRLQMIKAILTGTTTMTGKVAIVQDIERRPAFLMYVPIYNTSALPLPENRTKEFRCWIYSAFVMNEFMDGLLKEELKKFTTLYVVQNIKL